MNASLALLFVALGLALTRASRAGRSLGLLTLLATLAVSSPVVEPQYGLVGVALSAMATAASVYFVHELGLSAALAMSVNAGFWASALILPAGFRVDLLAALPCLSVMFLPRRYTSFPIKVLSSWVIAVAVLTVTLQLLPVTPGYLPDHME